MFGTRRSCAFPINPLLRQNAATVFVRSPPFQHPRFALTDDVAHRTQYSNLRSGPRPRSYGAFPPTTGTPSSRSSHTLPPYDSLPYDSLPCESPPYSSPPYSSPSYSCPSYSPPYTSPPNPPRSAAPRPTPTQPPTLIYIPHPTNGPSQKRAPTVTSRGLSVCLVIILLQTVFIVCRSDALAQFLDLESVIIRSVKERARLELEREKLRRERELWERALEDRVPQGAYWEFVWPAWDCRAYGKREYWGVLRNVPQNWTAIEACINMPVEIKGVTVRRPYRCSFVNGSPHIRGYWMVDWNQPDCKPWFQEFRDAVSPRLPLHRYVMVGLTHSRDVQTKGLVPVESRPISWV